MLAITGLSKTYGNGVRALDRVDLTIGRGLGRSSSTASTPSHSPREERIAC